MFEITREAIDARNAAVKTAGPPGVPHRDLQGSITPAHLAALRQDCDGAAPGSSYHEHAGSADVQQIDAATASGERNLRQLGARRPSGDPAVSAGQPEHTAPSGAGARFRVSPSRDMSGLDGLACLTTVGRQL